jgi:hypothetical protein
MSFFVAGLDLGQAQDYSGLVILEVSGTEWQDDDGRPIEIPPLTKLDVRHVERFPLSTKYAKIAADVEERLRNTPTRRYLAVDQTGVGNGVIEMLSRLNPFGITITGGSQAQIVSPRAAHVPKRDLVALVQVGLQNKILRIAKGLPHADLLTRELLNFRAKITDAGNDTYAAWREADHDDLVLAVAIGTWYAQLVLEGQEWRVRQRAAAEATRALNQRVRISQF